VKRRSALPVDLAGTVDLLEGFFSQAAIVAEAFDFDQTSVGLKADLSQTGRTWEEVA
jgi:hypothetical protein